jgi:hypothetical protein
VGRALGLLDLDDRPGVGLVLSGPHEGLPDIDWVAIPGGEFLYGDKKKRRRCDAFRIAATPSRNAQFQAFLDAGMATATTVGGGA